MGTCTTHVGMRILSHVRNMQGLHLAAAHHYAPYSILRMSIRPQK